MLRKYICFRKQEQKYLINFIRTTCVAQLVYHTNDVRVPRNYVTVLNPLIYSRVHIIHFANSLLRHCRPVVARHY